MIKQLVTLGKRQTKAVAGGLSVTVIGLIGTLSIGRIAGYEAEQLLEQTLPNINMLCNTIILASATILALLLTLLAFSSSIKADLKSSFYQRVKQVAFVDTSLFVITMVVFLLLNFPAAKSESLPAIWFQSVYYATVLASALVGGMIVSVMILLYETVSDLIDIVGLKQDGHPLLAEIEDD
jgi:hypothetical protein